MINLSNLTPNKVSTDVNSYSMLLYGESKSGKTTLVHNLYGNRVLHIMTEKRYKALEGAYVQYISSWSEYLQVMRELSTKKELKDQFDVISIDTVENLYEYLEKFVAGKYEEENVGDRDDLWGKDWVDLRNMWKSGLLKIERAGFTPVFVSHAIQQTVQIPTSAVMSEEAREVPNASEIKDKKTGKAYIEFLQYQPDLKEKVLAPINKMVDNILYIALTVDENGKEQRVIHLRSTMQWQAGSTFKNIQSPIPLSAEAYKNAIEEAVNSIDDEFKKEERFSDFDIKSEALDFDTLMTEAKSIAKTMATNNKMDVVTAVVEEVFGVGALLTQASPKQVELLSVAVSRLQEEKERAGI